MCQTVWFEYLRKSPVIFKHNSQEFAENGAKNKKHPVSSCSTGKNVLLMSKVRGEGTYWSKLTGR